MNPAGTGEATNHIIEPKTVKSRVLLAIRDTDVPFAQSILCDDLDLAFCHTLETAQAAFDNTIGLVVCGVHLDKGSVFDFLKFVRSRRKGGDTPFLVMLDRSKRSGFMPAIVHGLRMASQAHGATAFTDLTKLVESLGPEKTIAVLRKRMHEFMQK